MKTATVRMSPAEVRNAYMNLVHTYCVESPQPFEVAAPRLQELDLRPEDSTSWVRVVGDLGAPQENVDLALYGRANRTEELRQQVERLANELSDAGFFIQRTLRSHEAGQMSDSLHASAARARALLAHGTERSPR